MDGHKNLGIFPYCIFKTMVYLLSPLFFPFLLSLRGLPLGDK